MSFARVALAVSTSIATALLNKFVSITTMNTNLHNPPMKCFTYSSGNTPKYLVFMLHGYGSNGNDLLTLAPEISTNIDDVLFASPNGCQNFEGGVWGCFQWYSLGDRSEEAMFKGGAAAGKIVEQTIADLAKKHNIPWENIFILGFSQGCALALHLSYRLKNQIAGVIGICGRLNKPELLKNDIKSHPNTILIHGQEDNVVPPQQMQIAAAALKDNGVSVKTYLRPKLAHGIDEESVKIINNFIKQKIRFCAPNG